MLKTQICVTRPQCVNKYITSYQLLPPLPAFFDACLSTQQVKCRMSVFMNVELQNKLRSVNCLMVDLWRAELQRDCFWKVCYSCLFARNLAFHNIEVRNWRMDRPKGSDFLQKRKDDVSPLFFWGGGGYINVCRWLLCWHCITASTEVAVLGNAQTKSTEVKFYIFLTVHLRIILVVDQPDRQFLLWYVYLNPLHVSSNSVLILRRTIVLIQHLV